MVQGRHLLQCGTLWETQGGKSDQINSHLVNLLGVVALKYVGKLHDLLLGYKDAFVFLVCGDDNFVCLYPHLCLFEVRAAVIGLELKRGGERALNFGLIGAKLNQVN